MKFKAWFINELGHEFSKDFESGEDMEEFIAGARRNVLEVARLIRILENDAVPREIKVQQIKLVRDNGDITEDEAIELALEYFA